jgi:hypothetical protein
MKTIRIVSAAQRAMLERVVADPAEARRRGLSAEQARDALAADGGGRLPERLGPLRPNRHGKR